MKQKCNKCGTKTELYCSRCRVEIEHKHRDFIPLLFWDKKNKVYKFGCTVIECPCNGGTGICSSPHINIPLNLLHEFDGDNIIKQVCG
jgi:hypothetical protein